MTTKNNQINTTIEDRQRDVDLEIAEIEEILMRAEPDTDWAHLEERTERVRSENDELNDELLEILKKEQETGRKLRERLEQNPCSCPACMMHHPDTAKGLDSFIANTGGTVRASGSNYSIPHDEEVNPMTTELAAYNAAPASSIEPLAVYLIDGGIPSELPGLEDFNLNLGDATEVDFQIVYDPTNALHRNLRQSCVAGQPVTIRVALRDAGGSAVECQEFTCQVTRCRVSADDFYTRRGNDRRRLMAYFDLAVDGGVRDIC